MKIIREGREFELTAEELLAAYAEQEAIWDRSNVVQNMEWYLNSFEYMALSENDSFIACAATKLRKNEDEGLSYDDALRLAFKEAKQEFKAELASFVDPDTFDFSDRKAVETVIYNLLGNAEVENSRDLDVSSPYYKNAMELLEVFCSLEFPALYEAMHDSGMDLVFRDGEKYDYNLFYYNPDSVSHGQFVQCPFSVEQARRMLDNDDFVDVLAENTQYLADVNTLNFFDTAFELMDLKGQGRFLVEGIQEACAMILEETLDAGHQPLVAYNIDWDVDEAEDRNLLPKEIEIPAGMVDEDEISDYLSDMTGFCHKGFRLIEAAKPSLADQIQSASSRAAVSRPAEKAMEKEPDHEH